jgi:transcriptional regulator with XRE-family HTH domain
MAYRATTSAKIIARRVRKLRRALLLTQKELGEQFGVGNLAVWRWEHAVKVPQLKHQRTLYAMEIALANRAIGQTSRRGKYGDKRERR